ncbi:Rieske 2Fe-2S domain-containing protein [bacterium]|nr:Rieske 2Fe-2S domain-containing protein [bacterium]
MRVPIVRLSELGPGTTAPFRIDVDGQEEGAFVVRLSSGELRAYVNRCRHASLPLDWGDARFLDESGLLACRAHGARYAPEDGACVDGPCPGKKLRPVRVEVEGDLVVAREVAHASLPGSG